MAKHIVIGTKGEDLATKYLINSSYKILEKNWRFKHKEIDIIAFKDKKLIIIEVKTRSSNYFANSSNVLSKQKIKYLLDAANEYVESKNIEFETRFDLIYILNDKIEHIEEAFNPYDII